MKRRILLGAAVTAVCMSATGSNATGAGKQPLPDIPPKGAAGLAKSTVPPPHARAPNIAVASEPPIGQEVTNLVMQLSGTDDKTTKMALKELLIMLVGTHEEEDVITIDRVDLNDAIEGNKELGSDNPGQILGELFKIDGQAGRQLFEMLLNEEEETEWENEKRITVNNQRRIDMIGHATRIIATIGAGESNTPKKIYTSRAELRRAIKVGVPTRTMNELTKWEERRLRSAIEAEKSYDAEPLEILLNQTGARIAAEVARILDIGTNQRGRINPWQDENTRLRAGIQDVRNMLTLTRKERADTITTLWQKYMQAYGKDPRVAAGEILALTYPGLLGDTEGNRRGTLAANAKAQIYANIIELMIYLETQIQPIEGKGSTGQMSDACLTALRKTINEWAELPLNTKEGSELKIKMVINGTIRDAIKKIEETTLRDYIRECERTKRGALGIRGAGVPAEIRTVITEVGEWYKQTEWDGGMNPKRLMAEKLGVKLANMEKKEGGYIIPVMKLPEEEMLRTCPLLTIERDKVDPSGWKKDIADWIRGAEPNSIADMILDLAGAQQNRIYEIEDLERLIAECLLTIDSMVECTVRYGRRPAGTARLQLLANEVECRRETERERNNFEQIEQNLQRSALDVAKTSGGREHRDRYIGFLASVEKAVGAKEGGQYRIIRRAIELLTTDGIVVGPTVMGTPIKYVKPSDDNLKLQAQQRCKTAEALAWIASITSRTGQLDEEVLGTMMTVLKGADDGKYWEGREWSPTEENMLKLVYQDEKEGRYIEGITILEQETQRRTLTSVEQVPIMELYIDIKNNKRDAEIKEEDSVLRVGPLGQQQKSKKLDALMTERNEDIRRALRWALERRAQQQYDETLETLDDDRKFQLVVELVWMIAGKDIFISSGDLGQLPTTMEQLLDRVYGRPEIVTFEERKKVIKEVDRKPGLEQISKLLRDECYHGLGKSRKDIDEHLRKARELFQKISAEAVRRVSEDSKRNFGRMKDYTGGRYWEWVMDVEGALEDGDGIGKLVDGLMVRTCEGEKDRAIGGIRLLIRAWYQAYVEYYSAIVRNAPEYTKKALYHEKTRMSDPSDYSIAEMVGECREEILDDEWDRPIMQVMERRYMQQLIRLRILGTKLKKVDESKVSNELKLEAMRTLRELMETNAGVWKSNSKWEPVVKEGDSEMKKIAILMWRIGGTDHRDSVEDQIGRWLRLTIAGKLMGLEKVSKRITNLEATGGLQPERIRDRMKALREETRDEEGMRELRRALPDAVIDGEIEDGDELARFTGGEAMIGTLEEIKKILALESPAELAPLAEGAPPTVEGTQPMAEGTPPIGGIPPVIEGAQPGAEATPPVEETPPVIGGAQPDAEAAPPIDEAPPVVEEAQPVAEGALPEEGNGNAEATPPSEGEEPTEGNDGTKDETQGNAVWWNPTVAQAALNELIGRMLSRNYGAWARAITNADDIMEDGHGEGENPSIERMYKVQSEGISVGEQVGAGGAGISMMAGMLAVIEDGHTRENGILKTWLRKACAWLIIMETVNKESEQELRLSRWIELFRDNDIEAVLHELLRPYSKDYRMRVVEGTIWRIRATQEVIDKLVVPTEVEEQLGEMVDASEKRRRHGKGSSSGMAWWDEGNKHNIRTVKNAIAQGADDHKYREALEALRSMLRREDVYSRTTEYIEWARDVKVPRTAEAGVGRWKIYVGSEEEAVATIIARAFSEIGQLNYKGQDAIVQKACTAMNRYARLTEVTGNDKIPPGAVESKLDETIVQHKMKKRPRRDDGREMNWIPPENLRAEEEETEERREQEKIQIGQSLNQWRVGQGLGEIETFDPTVLSLEKHTNAAVERRKVSYVWMSMSKNEMAIERELREWYEGQRETSGSRIMRDEETLNAIVRWLAAGKLVMTEQQHNDEMKNVKTLIKWVAGTGGKLSRTELEDFGEVISKGVPTTERRECEKLNEERTGMKLGSTLKDYLTAIRNKILPRDKRAPIWDYATEMVTIMRNNRLVKSDIILGNSGEAKELEMKVQQMDRKPSENAPKEEITEMHINPSGNGRIMLGAYTYLRVMALNGVNLDQVRETGDAAIRDDNSWKKQTKLIDLLGCSIGDKGMPGGGIPLAVPLAIEIAKIREEDNPAGSVNVFQIIQEMQETINAGGLQKREFDEDSPMDLVAVAWVVEEEMARARWERDPEARKRERWAGALVNHNKEGRLGIIARLNEESGQAYITWAGVEEAEGLKRRDIREQLALLQALGSRRNIAQAAAREMHRTSDTETLRVGEQLDTTRIPMMVKAEIARKLGPKAEKGELAHLYVAVEHWLATHQSWRIPGDKPGQPVNIREFEEAVVAEMGQSSWNNPMHFIANLMDKCEEGTKESIVAAARYLELNKNEVAVVDKLNAVAQGQIVETQPHRRLIEALARTITVLRSGDIAPRRLYTHGSSGRTAALTYGNESGNIDTYIKSTESRNKQNGMWETPEEQKTRGDERELKRRLQEWEESKQWGRMELRMRLGSEESVSIPERRDGLDGTPLQSIMEGIYTEHGQRLTPRQTAIVLADRISTKYGTDLGTALVMIEVGQRTNRFNRAVQRKHGNSTDLDDIVETIGEAMGGDIADIQKLIEMTKEATERRVKVGENPIWNVDMRALQDGRTGQAATEAARRMQNMLIHEGVDMTPTQIPVWLGELTKTLSEIMGNQTAPNYGRTRRIQRREKLIPEQNKEYELSRDINGANEELAKENPLARFEGISSNYGSSIKRDEIMRIVCEQLTMRFGRQDSRTTTAVMMAMSEWLVVNTKEKRKRKEELRDYIVEQKDVKYHVDQLLEELFTPEEILEIQEGAEQQLMWIDRVWGRNERGVGKTGNGETATLNIDDVAAANKIVMEMEQMLRAQNAYSLRLQMENVIRRVVSMPHRFDAVDREGRSLHSRYGDRKGGPENKWGTEVIEIWKRHAQRAWEPFKVIWEETREQREGQSSTAVRIKESKRAPNRAELAMTVMRVIKLADELTRGEMENRQDGEPIGGEVNQGLGDRAEPGNDGGMPAPNEARRTPDAGGDVIPEPTREPAGSGEERGEPVTGPVDEGGEPVRIDPLEIPDIIADGIPEPGMNLAGDGPARGDLAEAHRRSTLWEYAFKNDSTPQAFVTRMVSRYGLEQNTAERVFRAKTSKEGAAGASEWQIEKEYVMAVVEEQNKTGVYEPWAITLSPMQWYRDEAANRRAGPKVAKTAQTVAAPGFKEAMAEYKEAEKAGAVMLDEGGMYRRDPGLQPMIIDSRGGRRNRVEELEDFVFEDDTGNLVGGEVQTITRYPVFKQTGPGGALEALAALEECTAQGVEQNDMNMEVAEIVRESKDELHILAWDESSWNVRRELRINEPSNSMERADEFARTITQMREEIAELRNFRRILTEPRTEVQVLDQSQTGVRIKKRRPLGTRRRENLEPTAEEPRGQWTNAGREAAQGVGPTADDLEPGTQGEHGRNEYKITEAGETAQNLRTYHSSETDLRIKEAPVTPRRQRVNVGEPIAEIADGDRQTLEVDRAKERKKLERLRKRQREGMAEGAPRTAEQPMVRRQVMPPAGSTTRRIVRGPTEAPGTAEGPMVKKRMIPSTEPTMGVGIGGPTTRELEQIVQPPRLTVEPDAGDLVGRNLQRGMPPVKPSVTQEVKDRIEGNDNPASRPPAEVQNPYGTQEEMSGRRKPRTSAELFGAPQPVDWLELNRTQQPMKPEPKLEQPEPPTSRTNTALIGERQPEPDEINPAQPARTPPTTERAPAGTLSMREKLQLQMQQKGAEQMSRSSMHPTAKPLITGINPPPLPEMSTLTGAQTAGKKPKGKYS
jgi:hypothetical protein